MKFNYYTDTTQAFFITLAKPTGKAVKSVSVSKRELIDLQRDLGTKIRVHSYNKYVFDNIVLIEVVD